MKKRILLNYSNQVLLLVGLLTYANSALAQTQAHAAFNNRVTFSIPAYWRVTVKNELPAGTRIGVEMFYPQTLKTPHSAGIAINVDTVDKAITIDQVVNRVYSKQYPQMAIVRNLQDGTHWRTIVWTAFDKGTEYVMLNRFGCFNGIAVQALVAFPLLEKGDPDWEKVAVRDFNTFCSSLQIDGQNSAQVTVSPEEIPSLQNRKIKRKRG